MSVNDAAGLSLTISPSVQNIGPVKHVVALSAFLPRVVDNGTAPDGHGGPKPRANNASGQRLARRSLLSMMDQGARRAILLEDARHVSQHIIPKQLVHHLLPPCRISRVRITSCERPAARAAR